MTFNGWYAVKTKPNQAKHFAQSSLENDYIFLIDLLMGPYQRGSWSNGYEGLFLKAHGLEPHRQM